jgi:hypothetical protein
MMHGSGSIAPETPPRQYTGAAQLGNLSLSRDGRIGYQWLHKGKVLSNYKPTGLNHGGILHIILSSDKEKCVPMGYDIISFGLHRPPVRHHPGGNGAHNTGGKP